MRAKRVNFDKYCGDWGGARVNEKERSYSEARAEQSFCCDFLCVGWRGRRRRLEAPAGRWRGRGGWTRARGWMRGPRVNGRPWRHVALRAPPIGAYKAAATCCRRHSRSDTAKAANPHHQLHLRYFSSRFSLARKVERAHLAQKPFSLLANLQSRHSSRACKKLFIFSTKFWNWWKLIINFVFLRNLGFSSKMNWSVHHTNI